MLPLRDTVRTYSFPIINISLIVANTLIFLYTAISSTGENYRLVYRYGLIPARLTSDSWIALLTRPQAVLTLFTHMFLHAGWFHFLSNIWTLYIFGDNVEDRMGPRRYLLFYLLGGIIAGLLQVLITPDSTIPAIGASGAIAGVLGAYFVLYPRARVVTLIFLFIIPWFLEIPALLYLGFWFASQLLAGLSYLGIERAASMGGVAWWAHIGGFLFGVIFYRFFTPRVHPAYIRHLRDERTSY